MKINVKNFRQYLKKASLNGNIDIINLNFTETGLKTNVTDFAGIGAVLTEMSADKFIDYEPIGQIFIKSTKKLMAYLNTFTNEVTISVEDYVFKITDGNRIVNVLIGAENICENLFTRELPDIPLTTDIILTKDQIKNSIGDTKLLDINQIVLNKSETTLTLEVGVQGQSDYTRTDIETTATGVGHVKLGLLFIQLYDVLEGEFKLSMGTDVPAIIEETTELMNCKCLIAPMIDI